MTTERTSERVAKIAARILALDPPKDWRIVGCGRTGPKEFETVSFAWADIQAIAASDLTQVQSRSKHLPTAKRAKARGG